MGQMEPTPLEADDEQRAERYHRQIRHIESILEEEEDWVSAMATVVCELHHAFAYFDWTGFYRRVADRELAVGPYQGGHGCLRIDFDRGICGAAARNRETELVDDVTARPDHIACAASTKSEIVVPVLTPEDELVAVLDVDSDAPAAFREVDRRQLERLCDWLGRCYADSRL